MRTGPARRRAPPPAAECAAKGAAGCDDRRLLGGQVLAQALLLLFRAHAPVVQIVPDTLCRRDGLGGVRHVLSGFLLAGEDLFFGRPDGLLAGAQVLLRGAQPGEAEPVVLLRGQAFFSGAFVSLGIGVMGAEPLARAADRSAKMPDAGQQGSQRGAYAFQLGGVAAQVISGGGGVRLGAGGYGEAADLLGQPCRAGGLGGQVTQCPLVRLGSAPGIGETACPGKSCSASLRARRRASASVSS